MSVYVVYCLLPIILMQLWDFLLITFNFFEEINTKTHLPSQICTRILPKNPIRLPVSVLDIHWII